MPNEAEVEKHQDWKWWKDEAYKVAARAEAAEMQRDTAINMMNIAMDRAEAAEKRAGSDVKYEAALIRAVAELGYDVAYAKDAEGVISAVLEARS